MLEWLKNSEWEAGVFLLLLGLGVPGVFLLPVEYVFGYVVIVFGMFVMAWRRLFTDKAIDWRSWWGCMALGIWGLVLPWEYIFGAYVISAALIECVLPQDEKTNWGMVGFLLVLGPGCLFLPWPYSIGLFLILVGVYAFSKTKDRWG